MRLYLVSESGSLYTQASDQAATHQSNVLITGARCIFNDFNGFPVVFRRKIILSLYDRLFSVDPLINHKPPGRRLGIFTGSGVN